MVRGFLAALVLAAVLPGCRSSSPATSEPTCPQSAATVTPPIRLTEGVAVTETDDPDTALTPSMVQLLANPERYHGRLVQVVGFLVLEFENNALYLVRDAAEHDQFSESVWVSFADGVLPPDGMQRYNRHMVMVEGRFDAEERGHMGLFSGHIVGITRAVCEPSQQGGCGGAASE